MLLVAVGAATTVNVDMLMRPKSDRVDLGSSCKSVAAASLLAVNHFNTHNSSLISKFGQLSSYDVQSWMDTPTDMPSSVPPAQQQL